MGARRSAPRRRAPRRRATGRGIPMKFPLSHGTGGRLLLMPYRRKHTRALHTVGRHAGPFKRLPRHGAGFWDDAWSGIKSVGSVVGPPLINLALKRFGLGGSMRRRPAVRRRHASASGGAVHAMMRAMMAAPRRRVHHRVHRGGLLYPGMPRGLGYARGGSMIPLRQP